MKVLVIDDDRGNRESIARYLELEGIDVVTADNGLAGQRYLETTGIDTVLVDLKMPEMDGLGFLEWLQREGPRVPAIMISAFGEVSDAVKAMKLGAFDYLVKPFNPDELVLRINRAVESQSMLNQVEAGKVNSKSTLPPLGESNEMIEIDTIVAKIASAPSSVLITGESGTGKEIVARLIHDRSGRGDLPFVAVNLAGIPETLIESELFGYEKGAFTGADSRKIGMFELAAAGTVFLDEIGDMPPALQAKILRALQERVIRRLGGTHQVPIGARIIAATNRDLEAAVKTGAFREDLYYRLAVVAIHIPPLRERITDLPLLIGSLMEKLSHKIGKPVEGVRPEAINLLSGYRFPGNVRELENIIERAIIFADGSTIEARDILVPGATTAPLPKPKTLRAIERLAIREALSRWEGNRTKAAEELEISRRSLLYKIKDYGLDDE